MNFNKIKNSKYLEYGLVILIIIIGELFLFWPIFSGKFIFPPEQIGHYHYIYFTAMQNFIYKLGMLPNWWPAYDSGYPINLTLDGFLNPVFILSLKFLSPFTANNLMIFIFFLINSLAFYLFAKNIGISKIGSLISSLSYSFSGAIVLFSGVTSIVALLNFLPLSFLCCLKIMRGEKKWLLIWLVLLLYSWIGGWSEMIIYGLFATIFFAIYLNVKEKNNWRLAFFRLILFFGAVALTVLILSPWFLSVIDFISYSSRSGGVEIKTAMNSPSTLSYFIHMFHPRLDVFYGTILPFIPLSQEHPETYFYIGALPLLFLFSSFFINNKKEKGHLVFFIFLALSALFITISNSPLFWALHKLPVLKWFQGQWKWSFVIVFSLAVLSGYGADNIRDFFRNRFSSRIIIIFWILFCVIIMGLIFTTIFGENIKSALATYGENHYKNSNERTLNRSPEYYQNIIEKMADSLVNNFSFSNKLVVLTVIVWLVTLAFFTALKFERVSYQKWRIFAVFVTFLGSTLVWIGFSTGPKISYLKEEPPAAKYLHSINPYKNSDLPLDVKSGKNITPYRIFLYTPDQFTSVLSEKYQINLVGDGERTLFTKEIMDDNLHLAFNFDAFYNHQTLVPKRLIELYQLVKRQKKFSYNDSTLFNEYINSFSEEKNFKLMGALNIKYILTPIELAKQRKSVFTNKILDDKLPIYVYENPYFMPRWYFAENIKWTKKNDETALKNMQTINNFKKTTLLEFNSLNDLAIKYGANDADELTVLLYAPGKLKIKTKTKNYRFLVFSESKEPFWQVKINGVKAPLYTANYLYQAALVPPGENIVEFYYPDMFNRSILSLHSILLKKAEK